MRIVDLHVHRILFRFVGKKNVKSKSERSFAVSIAILKKSCQLLAL